MKPIIGILSNITAPIEQTNTGIERIFINNSYINAVQNQEEYH